MPSRRCTANSSRSSIRPCSTGMELPMPQPERRLAIIGFGKMGKLIEQLAPGYGFTVALKLDEFNNTSYEGVTAENFRGIDVAVDFSIPRAVVENVERISALGVNMVLG